MAAPPTSPPLPAPEALVPVVMPADTRARKPANLCVYGECRKNASYNHLGLKPRFCAAHMEDDMYDVKHDTMCIHAGCQEQATYNTAGHRSMLCAEHKKEGMVWTSKPVCSTPNCYYAAFYAVHVNAPVATACRFHKTDQMYIIRSRWCRVCGCTRRSTYGIPGTTTPLVCKKHNRAEFGFTDVANRRCAHEGCSSQPRFMPEGTTKATHCSVHKTPDMQSYRSRALAKEPTRKRALAESDAAVVGADTEPTTDGTTDAAPTVAKRRFVRRTIHRCLVDECNRVANQNFPGCHVPMYCVEHRHEGMVALDLRRKCCAVGCNRLAACYFMGECLSRCLEHCQPGMRVLSHKYVCLEPNCDRAPKYNESNVLVPLYCKHHRKDGMVDVFEESVSTGRTRRDRPPPEPTPECPVPPRSQRRMYRNELQRRRYANGDMVSMD